ncbi:MAG: DMT family transporter [Candidatus Berkiellales bacterium]
MRICILKLFNGRCMQQKHSFKLYLLFMSIILVWGMSWPMNKIGIQYLPPIWFAALRLLIGTISMFLFLILQGKWFWPTRKDIPIIFTMGILQVGLFSTFINLGLHYVEAGRSAILTYTTPLWVIPLAVLLFKEKISFLTAVGFVLGMLGILVLFSPWSIDWSLQKVLVGNGILLLAAICFAISIICARNMQWHHSLLELLPWQLLVGTVPILILAALSHPNPEIEWNHLSISTLIYTGVLSTAFGFWGSVVVSTKLPSITVSLGLLGVPICGLIFSMLLLNEPFTTPIKIAIILIPMGLSCVALGTRKKG